MVLAGGGKFRQRAVAYSKAQASLAASGCMSGDSAEASAAGANTDDMNRARTFGPLNDAKDTAVAFSL